MRKRLSLLVLHFSFFGRWYDGGDSQREYEDYFHSTPPLWPFPPALYKSFSGSAKLYLCFEFPGYAYEGSSRERERVSPV